MIENVVYILGAGFSAPAGLPVLSKFRFRSEDMYRKDADTYSHFKDVFDAIRELSTIKNVFSSDLYNIEEILSIVEMKRALTGEVDEDMFVRYIADVIEYHTPPFVKSENQTTTLIERMYGASPVWRRYGSFAVSLFNLLLEENSLGTAKMKLGQPKARYSVVTFNYDRLLERAIEKLNMATFDDPVGFVDSYDEATAYKPLLAKLHGDVEDKSIVPPTWNKSLRDNMVSTWQSAYHAIREATQVRFVGYSIPSSDAYARYLLKSAVSENEYLKAIDVLCLTGDDQEVVERYRKFIDFTEFRFLNKSVENLFDWLQYEYQHLRSSQVGGAAFNRLEDAHHSLFD